MTAEQIVTAALTESQMDRILEMVATSLHTVREAVATVWGIIAPVVILWVAYQGKVLLSRQADNRKKLDENSAMTKYAAENTSAPRLR